MTPLVFNYQVGNPNATFPASLTVKSSDAGVSVNTLAPTHKYVAFGLTSTPPLPPSLGALTWLPTTEVLPLWTPLVFDGSNAYPNYTLEQFQAVDPTNVSAIIFANEDETIPLKITSISNVAPYTNLTYFSVYRAFLSDINFEDITLVPNATLPVSIAVNVLNMVSLTAVNNLPKNANNYYFADNNFVKSSVDNVLIELDNQGSVDKNLQIDGGYMDGPTASGIAAKNNLLSKGWSVFNSAGSSPLDSNINNVGFITNYVYNGVSHLNESVSIFNNTVNDDYENVAIFECNLNGTGVTFINNLNSYRNIYYLQINGSSSITNLDVTGISNLETLDMFGCTGLQNITVAPYYKNLVQVNFGNCALGVNSVNNILIAVDNNGKQGGLLVTNGGSNAAPTGDGLTAKSNLIAKGWGVFTNS
jgi:hypothetical protein